MLTERSFFKMASRGFLAAWEREGTAASRSSIWNSQSGRGLCPKRVEEEEGSQVKFRGETEASRGGEKKFASPSSGCCNSCKSGKFFLCRQGQKVFYCGAQIPMAPQCTVFNCFYDFCDLESVFSLFYSSDFRRFFLSSMPMPLLFLLFPFSPEKRLSLHSFCG